MRFTGIAVVAVLTLIAAVAANQPIAEDHALLAREGMPNTFKHIRRAAKKTTTSTKTTSTKTTSTETSSTTTKSSSSSSSSSSKSSSSSSSTSSLVADSQCTNSPTSRNCWSNGYSVATDFDEKWPTTGRTVKYTLTLSNTTCNPDGNGERVCLLVNNQYPGPTLYANWGDTLQVTVVNNLPYNGTGFHWHGVRQLGTNPQDGTNGVTECPLAPGESKTYQFQATQYGTSWWHSHYSAQYGDGVLGGIIFEGPATANYDIDLGTYTVSDWYYETAFQIAYQSNINLQNAQAPPTPDNILINGTNKNAAGGGTYGNVQLTPGKKHRLRLINTSVDGGIRVSLDNHVFQVISSDFVPIAPIQTDWLLIGIGQRYDVIINANQTSGNFWFRATTASECGNVNGFSGLSIFTYSGTTVANPTTTAWGGNFACVEPSPLAPWWNTTVSSTNFNSQVGDLEINIDQEQVATNGQNIVVWGVNLTAIDVDWEMPTLEYVATGNTSYPQDLNLIELPTADTWTYWIIQETAGTFVPIPHPIHLHGKFHRAIQERI